MVHGLETIKRLNDEAAARGAAERETTLHVYRLYLGVDLFDAREAGLILSLADHGFDGATVLEGTGVWQGETEDCTVIEIWARRSQEANVRSLAKDLQERHKQEAIGLVRLAADVSLIG